jgi:hypothetical protein
MDSHQSLLSNEGIRLAISASERLPVRTTADEVGMGQVHASANDTDYVVDK